MNTKESIIKAARNILAGDGNAYDRMNAIEGGIGMPSIINIIVSYCTENNITYKQIKAEEESGTFDRFFNDPLIFTAS